MNRFFSSLYSVALCTSFLFFALLLNPFPASAAELLPFPTQARQARPAAPQSIAQPAYRSTYRDQISSLNCDQLDKVRKSLLSNIGKSNRTDAKYYFSLMEVLDQVKQDKNCPQQ
jgi:hypothetical protein